MFYNVTEWSKRSYLHPDAQNLQYKYELIKKQTKKINKVLGIHYEY